MYGRKGKFFTLNRFCLDSFTVFQDLKQVSRNGEARTLPSDSSVVELLLHP